MNLQQYKYPLLPQLKTLIWRTCRCQIEFSSGIPGVKNSLLEELYRENGCSDVHCKGLPLITVEGEVVRSGITENESLLSEQSDLRTHPC